jgi:galactosamine-6-phosphate isomerase
MQIETFENPEALALHTAQYIIDLVRNKPDATLILTSGDTPVQTYKLITQMAEPGLFDKATIVGLDEWVGIPPTSEGSCRYIVEENLLKPLNVNPEVYTFFDGLSDDLESECKRIDKILLDKGGADFMIVGIGVNGHIGLNEPGTPFDLYCHVSQLADITVSVGQKYFKENTVLTQGITVGLKHLMEAKTAVIIASGARKAEILKRTVEEKPDPELPSTIFQLHTDGRIWADQAAAALI